MATKKNNKTEHVLKLITKNHEEQAESWDDNDTPVEEELAEDVMIEEIVPDAMEAEDELDLEIDKAPQQEMGAEFEFQPDLKDIPTLDKTKLINLTEILTLELMPEILIRMKVCQCESCKNDILALALNSLPQKYVTTDSGKQYKMIDLYRNQYETDVIAALTRACVRVKGSPRHE